jgi:hypothetical protein
MPPRQFLSLRSAGLILALLLAVVGWTARSAGAQQPTIVGDVPSEGVAILQTSTATTPAELTTSLIDLGCAPVGIAIADGGAWLIHIPGAPAFVNATFPATLPAGQLFLVRCEASSAAQQFNLLEASGPGSGPLVATLTDARTGGHAGFDRFVVEFADEAVPGYQIEYVTELQFTCGAGFEVTSAGNAALRIKLETARINDDEGQLTIPSRTLTPNLPALLDAQEICGFEGQVVWLLGLDSEQPFQLQLLTNPARLVIDIPRAAPTIASGVSGLALAGPQCPVVMADQPCPDLPVDVTLAFGQGGSTVSTVETGSDGTFALDLPVGTYDVTTVGGFLPSLGATEVTVPAGSHAWLELHLDTGIR